MSTVFPSKLFEIVFDVKKSSMVLEIFSGSAILP